MRSCAEGAGHAGSAARRERARELGDRARRHRALQRIAPHPQARCAPQRNTRDIMCSIISCVRLPSQHSFANMDQMLTLCTVGTMRQSRSFVSTLLPVTTFPRANCRARLSVWWSTSQRHMEPSCVHSNPQAAPNFWISCSSAPAAWAAAVPTWLRCHLTVSRFNTQKLSSGFEAMTVRVGPVAEQKDASARSSVARFHLAADYRTLAPQHTIAAMPDMFQAWPQAEAIFPCQHPEPSVTSHTGAGRGDSAAGAAVSAGGGCAALLARRQRAQRGRRQAGGAGGRR